MRVQDVVLVGMMGAILCGCSAPSKQTGVRIGDETLNQFEAGVTTEAWLLAVLGRPTSEAQVEGIPGTKVMRYALGESVGGLGTLLSGEASKNTSVVYFIATDGIVTRYWADRSVHYTLTGKPIDESSGVKLTP